MSTVLPGNCIDWHFICADLIVPSAFVAYLLITSWNGFKLVLPVGGKNKTSNLSIFNTAILVLENKSVFKGIGLGYIGEATGEVCFNTSLTGYQEIISDPSYAGQIINFTFPHIGNVGANNEDIESDKIWTRGVIFNSEITNPSNYRSLQNLDKWLKKNKIVGITGLDTRSLTNFIRDKGAPNATISNNKKGKFNINNLIKKTIIYQIHKLFKT